MEFQVYAQRGERFSSANHDTVMTDVLSLPAPTLHHESSATVTKGHSAVSFVPTEHVQTAVSEFGDHIVIDTIIPPSRYLPPTLSVTKLANQIQTELEGELQRFGLGMGSQVASVAHPRSKEAEAEQFVRSAAGQLVDPALAPKAHPHQNARARLGIRSLRGEPLLTYFPSPAAAEPVVVGGRATTCPCVCCRSGCTGADAHTGRLPVLKNALARDAAGNVMVDADDELAAQAQDMKLGEPFREPEPRPKELKAEPPVAMATAATAGAAPAPAPTLVMPSTSSSAPRAEQMPRLTPAVIPHVSPDAPRILKLHRSLGDLRGQRIESQSVPDVPRLVTPPSRAVDVRGEELDAVPPLPTYSRVTLRPPGGDVAPAIRQVDVPMTRAEKGMSVFAPLQVTPELQSQLMLNNVSSTSLSPMGERRTPPLSSPSSIGSTPRLVRSRPTDSSPGSLYSLDVNATPIAARYSRSTSNLRQAARERDLPPVPPVPTVLPTAGIKYTPWSVPPPSASSDSLYVREPNAAAAATASYPATGTRVRIVSGNSPLVRNQVYHSP